MTDNLGLYIHIPFCNKKCAYCDFYSVFPIGTVYEDYFSVLLEEIKKWGGKLANRPIDTIYIGGGTPSLLGQDIIKLISCIKENFNVLNGAEITAEANPEDLVFLPFAKIAGVNRLSVGAQSFCDKTLKVLGRSHSAADTEKFYYKARETGFNNISLDLMMALPEGNLEYDLKKITELSPEHISAYILKREERTKFYKTGIPLPDDDTAADCYLYSCKILEESGYEHYEISNFCKKGFESRHNLKYWQAKEYLGLGAAAHSFLNGKRFYYKRDIKAFLNGTSPLQDGAGGEKEEKLMLNLRLKSGINLTDFYSPVPAVLKEKAERLKAAGLISGNFPQVCLTDKGMLLSNSVIMELIL